MLAAAFLMLVLSAQAPKVPPRAGAEVALEARAVLIPALPASVAEARKDYAATRKELEASYREAERYLAACNAELAELGPPGTRITIPAQAGGEAKVLMNFVYDGAFLTLEDPIMERWNAWQSTLLALGLALPVEAQRMADNMLLLSSSKTEVVDKVPPKGEQPALEILLEDPDDPEGNLLKVPHRINWKEILAVTRMNYGAHTEFGKQATALADAQAGKLARDWEPLTAHLNAGARTLLDLDRAAPATDDPGLKTLRLLARIHFMERFRSTLWFCQVVWAHLASERILPLPLM